MQLFTTTKLLERYVNDCFQINGKKIFKMAKKDETVKFKIYIRKIKSPFIIYADSESILVPENNGNQNSDQSYMNKYQNHLG